ncbi:hypothetical protein DMB66_04660 [Actinoplanes sp. ATCC 53533]|uniref:CATRA conflict system CASPASE/TPR repeat-associated protein n=1 Tax=Actinoplanes sp. ATCC 53533 TaxID=1288362 RepID=UPI000F782617|nr:CATRA conflict system CASPASE/TPR repeat-associated protein [Actinoplanes sp. ATCC 53533]RSM72681.1 hypothetical protein DMB66_04660 [Actinoplanes sp. ATCC 53533]
MTLRSYAMHVYTYLDGEDGVAALQELVEICGALGMPESPIEGTRGARTSGPEARRSFGGASERKIYQAIEYHTTRLTAFLACLVPADGRVWAQLDREWREAAGTAPAADCVGRVHLYYALYEGGSGVERLAGLASQALPAPGLLERRTDPAIRGHHADPVNLKHRTELFPGCHLWEVNPGADGGRDRVFALLSPANQEQRSDDWVWPAGSFRLPPLPGYLWEMAKVRHEARRFDERRSALVVPKLVERASRFEAAERSRGWTGKARDEELRALQRDTALASAGAAALRTMQRTVQAASGDALAILEYAGRKPNGGVFAADLAYVDWLRVEIADEADTAADAVSYAEPMAALATAAAEERRQRLTVEQTATIAAIGLFLAATQSIEYEWRTFASLQTPFVISVLFLGLLLPVVAMAQPSGREDRRWRGWVLLAGAGFAASTAWFVVGWLVRRQGDGPAPALVAAAAAAAGVIAAWSIFSARRRIARTLTWLGLQPGRGTAWLRRRFRRVTR